VSATQIRIGNGPKQSSITTMKTPFTTLALCAGIFALATTAQAGISFASGGSLTSWNGTPTYVSLANASLSSATTGQGDATITGSFGLMAETFTPSSSFTLGSFSILCSVNASTTYQVHLYDLGPAGTVSVNGTPAPYTPGTDLFSGLSLALSTSGGEVQGSFTLSGADQVSLLANEEYALEIWTPAAVGSAGITWFRNGGSPADPGGQMFSAGDSAGTRNTLAANGQAGGAPRIGALALYTVVPEPSSLALVGLGALALIIRKRK
jgi:hypothetical protein